MKLIFRLLVELSIRVAVPVQSALTE